MSSMELQDAILKAIDTLAQNRIDQIKADKTIKCTISKCTNALTSEYKATYNGGRIYVYAADGSTYISGEEVYVLVPEGDFSNKKIIVGYTTSGLNQDEEDNQSETSAALSDYNLIGSSIVKDKDNIQPVGLHSYIAEQYMLLYQHITDEEQESGSRTPLDTTLYVDGEALTNSLLEAEAVMLRASFQTNLPKAHRLSKTGEYGLTFTLAFADRDKVDEDGNPATKYYAYSMTSSNMTGNSFAYSSKSSNYQIFTIDTENFLYIDSIMFYEKGFESKDSIEDLTWGADIFLSDIQFYGLRSISATNGEYSLSISEDDGVTFKSVSHDDKLSVKGKVTKSKVNISDGTTFYWFKADSRVTAQSDDYQMYGGAGYSWLKDKSVDSTIYLYADENKAYKNEYLLVAVYKDSVVLKDKFTIYNEACKRDLSIESSLGVKFSFDRGTPELTCLIDGKSESFDSTHKDEWFSFVWSKVESDGTTTIFNQTKEEAEVAYKAKLKEGASYSEVSALKSLITSLEGVSWDRNKFVYPISKIDSSATFKCGVYLKDDGEVDTESYSIGDASIVLQNESVASPTDYYIEIENGDQVFQYSESGVSPDDERYTDPLEIKPLTCHFYDPAGLEVNDSTYVVKWLVPLTDSMVTVPAEGMVINPATNKIEWCTTQVFPMGIAGDYNSLALNNQVQAIVTYQGQTYTQYTSFFFTKVGENGTNGTDMVAKISAVSMNDGTYLPYILVDSSGTATWADGLGHNYDISKQFLSFKLYQRNSKLATSDSSVTWKVAGGNGSTRSRYLSVSGGVVTYSSWDSKQYPTATRNQIVRGSINWEDSDYYAFYPVPMIESSDNSFRIPNTTTLKSVMYNADGTNPVYDKNQGVSVEYESLTDPYIVWTAEGGPENITPDFKLIRTKNSSSGYTELKPEKIETENEDGTITVSYADNSSVYVLPNDQFLGGVLNNVAHAAIYADKDDYDNHATTVADVYIPIHMYLNTFELSSLNAWDGNSIEINEDENYILAPQIGAGTKDSNNRFTGIVMGKAEYYDQTNSKGASESSTSVGLLGYSEGRQSIFLNAEDGSATFGLPEDEYGSSDYTQGRIRLVPNGISSIGSWKIGSRSLYNIVQNFDIHDDAVDLSSPYSDMNSNYKTSIPSDSEGVLFSSDPAYLSIKGRLLNNGREFDEVSNQWVNVTADADFTAATTVVQPEDTLELQLDPNDTSIFTMYRHTVGHDPADAEFSVKQDSNGTYRIYKGGDLNNPYATAITNGSGIVIGWQHPEKMAYNGKYVIARQIYDRKPTEGDPRFIDSWYFCLMNKRAEEASKDGIYYLPERFSTKNEIIKYNRILFANFYWRREAKVGINSNGRFYTNALKDSTTSLTIGEMGAYGQSALMKKYVGAQFEIGNDSHSLVKFFTDYGDGSLEDKAGTLYVSGATDVNDEYQRPLVAAFKDISLYASDTSSGGTSKTMQTKMFLGRKDKAVEEYSTVVSENANANGVTRYDTYSNGYFGFENSSGQSAYLNLSGYYKDVIDDEANKETIHGERSHLYSDSGLIIETPLQDAASTYVTTSNLYLSAGGGSTEGLIKVDADKVVNIIDESIQTVIDDNDYSLKMPNLEFTYNDDTGTNVAEWRYFTTSTVETEGDDGTVSSEEVETTHTSLKFNNIQGVSLETDGGINAKSTGAPVIIESHETAKGIQLGTYYKVANKSGGYDENEQVYLHLLPQAGGSAGMFSLGSPLGSIGSVTDIKISGSSKMQGVNITPTLTVPHGIYLSGNFSGTGLTSISLYANQDIMSANGWMYANNFSFNSGPGNWSSYDTNSRRTLSGQLEYIYSLIRQLRNDLTSESNARSSADSALSSRVTTAQNTANSANSNANSRVSQSAFNSHQHWLQSNSLMQAVSGSIVTATVSGHKVVTSIPTSHMSNMKTTTPV